MNKLNYQIVHINDLDSESGNLESIASEWLPTHEFWSAESCISTLKNSEDFLTSAMVYNLKDGATMRASWHGCYFAIKQGTEWELLFIYVSKKCRRLGLGQILMKDLVERVQKKSTNTSNSNHSIFLEVRRSNIAAQKIYEGLGFKLLSTRPRYYSDGEDAHVYKLSTN